MGCEDGFAPQGLRQSRDRLADGLLDGWFARLSF
jgi:hypothetical protein